MSKINRDELIRLFRRMYDEHWPYVLGAAREGCVDCSGAFTYAYKALGAGGISHGSNAIARYHVSGLLPIREAVPGMAAFKLRKPGQQYYDLPARYAKDADQNDYYHIGLVDETGKWVLNAQGTKAGFTRTKLSAWGCVGYLKAVDYDDKKKEIPMHDMRVYAPSGMTVKMRNKPSLQGMVTANILIGETVQAGETTGDWTAITAPDGRKGYMMSKFLVDPSESFENASGDASEPQTENHTAYVRTLSTDEYNRLCDARDQLEGILKLIKSIVGVG